MAQVVVLGSLHFDILVAAPDRPRRGETLAGTGWAPKCGGKGGNQAVAAARHGARVAMAGAVGDDIFGARLLANLGDAGVDASRVVVRAGAASGMSVAILDPSGDYGAVIVSGANLSLDGSELAGLAAPRVLVLQNEVPNAANLAAARWARACGAAVLLNAAPARAMPPEMAGLLDLLIVNAVEAEMLAGVPVRGLDEAAAAASRLCRLAPAVLVSAGAAGLALAAPGAAPLLLDAHRITVASTHGAGDELAGALAARLAAGAPLAEAARYANAAAALLVATPEPARHALRADGVARLLAEAGAA